VIKPPFDPVTLATPFFILMVILEIVLAKYVRARARYEAKDTAASLLMGLGSTVAGVLTGGAIAVATIWVWNRRLFDIPMTAVWAWGAVFLLEDMTYYWFHRLSHERRVWWTSHVNHHSSQHYNLSTALRQTWTGALNGSWLPWLALAWLGFPPAMIAVQKGISLVYQYWIHTEAIKKTPRWFEAVFNTPSHHRVHHARNAVYLDRNYAGILIIWDRLFGTFQPELEDEPCRYGLVKNIATFNLLRVAFHEWIAMAADVARHPRHALGYVFGPPGWSHDASRETSAMIKARTAAGLSPAAAAATGRPRAARQGSPA
jgi:sterol desaturase/sphingolipid hydroxylase (fatty acid hydroxylase superfamily)